jgi:hypothetical protein
VTLHPELRRQKRERKKGDGSLFELRLNVVEQEIFYFFHWPWFCLGSLLFSAWWFEMKIIRAPYFIVLRFGCGGYEEGYLLAKPNNSKSSNVVFLMGSRLLLKMRSIQKW